MSQSLGDRVSQGHIAWCLLFKEETDLTELQDKATSQVGLDCCKLEDSKENPGVTDNYPSYQKVRACASVRVLNLPSYLQIYLKTGPYPSPASPLKKLCLVLETFAWGIIVPHNLLVSNLNYMEMRFMILHGRDLAGVSLESVVIFD